MSRKTTTFEGGCHCKRVRFRVHVQEVQEDKLEALRCNCSICRMKGILHLIVERDAFELLAGADHLTTYTFNTGVAKHTFCRVCGVESFYTPRSHPDGVDVNVHCLDGGVEVLSRFSIVPFDGDNWEANVDRIR